MAQTARKERKTYSLSTDSVSFIEQVKTELATDSASSALEKILTQARQQRSFERTESAIAAYYNSLSRDEVAEEAAWGKFGDSQLPLE